jgi:hypothetical protein
MRQIEVRTVDQDLKGLFVQGDFTGLSFTKKDINLILDELIATQTRTGAAPKRTRNELLTELVMRSLDRCYRTHPLDGGPLQHPELSTAASLVAAACRKGWFW